VSGHETTIKIIFSQFPLANAPYRYKGNNMTLNPIAIGAIVTTLITGILSLVGLIISKEQKTSEFRQEWINSLRNEISELLGNTETIMRYFRAVVDDQKRLRLAPIAEAELLEKVKDNIKESEKLYNQIQLRINREEHKAIIEALEVIRSQFREGNIPSDDGLHELEQQLIRVTQDILKTEWERVKSGEPVFRIAKYGAALLLICTLALAAYSVIMTNSEEKSQDEVEINI